VMSERAADYYEDDEDPAALWAEYDAAVACGDVFYTAPPSTPSETAAQDEKVRAREAPADAEEGGR
jgi:hypothetical protein